MPGAKECEIPTHEQGARMDQNLIDLVQKAKDGDQRAFEKLYVYCQKKLERFVQSKFSYITCVDDIVQETLMKVYEKLHTLREVNAFPRWICTIAENIAIREWRKEQKRKTRRLSKPRQPSLRSNFLNDEEREVQERKLSYDVEELPSREQDPMDIVAEREEFAECRDYLDQLPSLQQQCIRMYYLEGQPVAEIAKTLDKPEGTIKRWLYEGRQKLQEMRTGNLQI
jgi:RNA polymerase sigma-70 factor (ECF subfamily)